MSAPPVLTASCSCGSIKLTLTGVPDLWLCHCLNCRKQTGSLFATQLFYRHEEVELHDPDGKLTKYSFVAPDHADPKTAPAPNKAWCGKCGCPVWIDLGGHGPGGMIVRYGLVDAEGEEAQKILDGLAEGAEGKFQPRLELFCKRKAAWAKGWKVDAAEQIEEMRPGFWEK